MTASWDAPPGLPGGPPTAWPVPTGADVRPGVPGDRWISPPPPPAPPSAWGPGPVGPSTPPSGSSGPWRAALALVAVAALVAAGVVALDRVGDDDLDPLAAGAPSATATTGSTTVTTGPDPTVTAPPTTRPPTTTTAPPVRRAAEVPLPAELGPHVYLDTEDDGDPVTWDPCDPIRFVTNGRLAPPGAAEILAEAMARVTAATGLVFEDAGPSDEPPPTEGSRRRRDPARYGPGWSPVLISWTDETEVPDLVEYAGLALPLWVWTGGDGSALDDEALDDEATYVTGSIELDVRDVADMLSWGERDHVVALVMHELGHLVGLDHVQETTEVMAESGVIATDWGPGDRYGLATLGRGECNPDR